MPMDNPSYQPLDDAERLRQALSELDATADEVANWVPLVQQLHAWPERRVTSADNQRLLAVLAPLVQSHSVVRQAIADRYGSQRSYLAWLLDTARVQIASLPRAFWLLSAALTAIGAWIELVTPNEDASLALRALGPLLAYFGISMAFRGISLKTYECELTCPASALQLALARLVIVLGYDVVLGICLSLALWLRGVPGDTRFFLLTLHWLMPLLLVAGIALVLSLRLPSALAAAIAYGVWLGVLAFWYALTQWIMVQSATAHGGAEVSLLSVVVELALGVVGLCLLAVGALRLPGDTARLVSGF
jgi:hypothetical protein